MEICVNEYVRIPIGIFIISHINIDFDDNDKNKCLLCQNEKVLFLSIETIKSLKHSKNIIDLVEVGDYVNGYRVEQVSIETNEVLLDHNGFGWRAVKDGDKIVTHEQMASIEYKLEEGK